MFVSPTFLSNALTFALESYSIIEELKLRIIYELQPVCTEPLSERRSGQRAGVKERLLKVKKETLLLCLRCSRQSRRVPFLLYDHDEVCGWF